MTIKCLKTFPGDVALLIKDSFFCPKSESGEARVCCPLDGIDPPIEQTPTVEDKGSNLIDFRAITFITLCHFRVAPSSDRCTTLGEGGAMTVGIHIK